MDMSLQPQLRLMSTGESLDTPWSSALVAALVLVTRRRMAEAEARVRGELLGELLTHRVQDYDLLRTAQRYVQKSRFPSKPVWRCHIAADPIFCLA
jgi:hypothetical protein